MGFQIFEARIARSSLVQLGDGATPGGTLLLLPAGAGTLVYYALGTNNDVVDHILWLSMDSPVDGGRVGSITLPARSGFDGTAAVDILAALFPGADAQLMLSPANALYVGTDDTLTGSLLLVVFASCGDF